jgi:hypothetical protein
MTGLMNENDRNLLRDGIQILAHRMSQLGKLGIVVSETDDKTNFLYRHIVASHPVAQCLLQRSDVFHLSVRRG